MGKMTSAQPSQMNDAPRVTMIDGNLAQLDESAGGHVGQHDHDEQANGDLWAGGQEAG